jgi:hypothetical protein
MIEKTLKFERRLEIKLVSLSEMVQLLGGDDGRRKELIEKYHIPCEYVPEENLLLARVDCVGPSLATYDEYLATELTDKGQFTKEETEEVWKEICADVQGL